MTTRVLLFKTGMLGEYSTVAVFSAAEASQAIAYWEDNPSDYVTCDLWEGDREIETHISLKELKAMFEVAANRRRRSSRPTKRSSRHRS